MTPEELEAIPGIGPKMVEKIQLAVNAYYGQFEAAGRERGSRRSEEPPAAKPRRRRSRAVEPSRQTARRQAAGSRIRCD